MTDAMKNSLELIRDRKLSMPLFRHHSNILAGCLVDEFFAKIPASRWLDVVPVLIFRASLIFISSIVDKCPASPIGFMGLKRDEETAIAEKYYSNLPKMQKSSIVAVFDPMLGTAGTLDKTCEDVRKRYITDTGLELDGNNIYFIGFLAARSGYQKALAHMPADNVILLAIDPELDARKFIVPGLGDFGDRYFG